MSKPSVEIELSYQCGEQMKKALEKNGFSRAGLTKLIGMLSASLEDGKSANSTTSDVLVSFLDLIHEVDNVEKLSDEQVKSLLHYIKLIGSVNFDKPKTSRNFTRKEALIWAKLNSKLFDDKTADYVRHCYLWVAVKFGGVRHEKTNRLVIFNYPLPKTPVFVNYDYSSYKEYHDKKAGHSAAVEEASPAPKETVSWADEVVSIETVALKQ